MNKISYFLCLVLIVLSCQNDKARITSFKAFEIQVYFPPQHEIHHGEWLKIDGFTFVHHKYSTTSFEGPVPEKVKVDTAYLIKSTRYVVAEGKLKTLKNRTSGNEIAMDLARHLAALTDSIGKPIFKIDNGPKLLFQGIVDIKKADGSEFLVELERGYNGKVSKLN